MDIFNRYFEAGGWNMGELPIEEAASLGFGVTVLLVVSICAGLIMARGGAAAHSKPDRFTNLILVSPYLALMAFMMKSGLNSAGRLIAPYYCLLLPALLRGEGQVFVVRQVWWRAAAVLVFLIAILAVVLTPARPLWPAVTVTERLRQWRPHSAALARAARVYSVYSGRGEALAPVCTLLPPEEKVIGIISWGDDPVATLWKPFGSRRLVFFLPQDSISELEHQGVRYMVISPAGVELLLGISAEAWAQKFNAYVVGRVTLNRKAGGAPEQWTVVRLRSPQQALGKPPERR